MNRSTTVTFIIYKLIVYSNRKICCIILLSYTRYTNYMFPSIDKILMSHSHKKFQQEGATNSTLLLCNIFVFLC